jgi:2-polyprenyl-3-methyl-5-hydroxy-6-metoxy-1,4-benzoquinol methylase
MGFIGGALGVRAMTWLSPNGHNPVTEHAVAYENVSKLETLLGPDVFQLIQGKTVIDFGCGTGAEAVEMALAGAARVIGLDICDSYLKAARERAAAAGIGDRCVFLTSPPEPADFIVSLDSFEHFDDPMSILETMDRYLKPNGAVLVSFGPAWYHPYGGHLFSLFPWAHLVFTEKTMLEWRRAFHPEQTARKVTECGLNKMTVRRFEQLVADSPFRFSYYDPRPIRKVRRFYNRLTREFFTSVVRCTLVRRNASGLALGPLNKSRGDG